MVDSQKFKTGQAVVSYQNKQMQEALEPLIKEISDSSNQLYATQSRLNKLNLEKYENEDIFFSDQYLDLLKTEKVLNIRIPEIAKRIDEIANSQSFVTPKKLLNQLELDEAY